MKKLRYFLTIALVMTFSIAFLSGCKFGSDYKQFEINYTVGLEFLVEEDYYDANLKGIATKKDDTTEDVTEKMEIDTNEFKKDTPGTYKIYCEFEGTELSYEVKVVEQITNVANINARLLPAHANTFKRDAEGVFSYEASNSTLYVEGVNLNEYMIYNDNNANLSIYLKYEVESTEDSSNKETTNEFWYTGTATEGILTMKTYDDPISVETIQDANIDILYLYLGILAEAGLPISVAPLGINDVEIGLTNGTLVMNQDGSYTVTTVQDGETYAMTYKNNIFTEVNGVDYTFPKSATAMIPEKPADTVVE